MHLPQDVRRQTRDGRLVARGRSRVGGVGRVDRRGEGLFHAPAWVRLDLEQVVETLVAKTGDVRLGEGWPLRQLGQQLQRSAKTTRRHVDGHHESVPTGIHVECGTEPLGGLGQLDSRVPLRALRHCPRREDRRSSHIGRLVAGSSPHDEIRRHERPARQVHGENLQTQRKDRPLEARELVRPRLPRRRARRQDLFERHAALSSSVVAAVAFAAGMYVSTTRLSGLSTSAATTWMSGALTAR